MWNRLLAKQLTAAFVRTVNTPGKYHDEHGLILRVVLSQRKRWISKSWVQRLVIHGRRRDLGLGAYPLVGLADARDRALDNRRIARSGGDPRARPAAAAPTFEEAFEAVLAVKAPAWKSPTSQISWRQTMRLYVFPHFGSRGVDTLTTSDMLLVLTPLWNDKPPTAKRVLQRMSAVCRWAIAEGYRSDDPTANVTSVLPKHKGEEKHHEAMPYAQVGAFLVGLREAAVPLPRRLALEFLTLTAARTSEVRLMTWDEVDTDARTWTVPAARMKMVREHRVPLAERAVAILDKARGLPRHGSRWVFPSTGGAELSQMALLRTMRRLGEAAATPHGMRSAFRDWCGEQSDAPHAVIEAALAHVVRNKTEAAYARSDLFERRRVLMEQWAAYLCP